ncbi:zinc finger protein ZAT4-like [Senna tora]|uniref:Zinc finger protein ZAT4-like n=1 Tax=Senna tora TaxID=362788 RepID=A0A834SUF4_9FABA|nr:zinc finger protein ZAT4-like [Senna tora]
MEKHKCKLCSRTFANGRSLGGHMKAHLATLPLPPKPHAPPPPPPPLLSPSPSPSHSLSSSFSSEEKALIYGLRENPKKSIRLADPESLIVQDRESETESKNTTSTNPTRLRSKRARTRAHRPTLKKPKPKPTPTTTEPEPASSVSDACTEEDLAMCLMMLSRDKWMRNIVKGEEETEKSKTKKQRFDLRCDKCRKTFRSSRALESHKNVCFRQALGGHKRSHLLPSSSSSNVAINDSGRLKLQSFIDLNLPAPAEEEDEELSVVSDA